MQHYKTPMSYTKQLAQVDNLFKNEQNECLFKFVLFSLGGFAKVKLATHTLTGEKVAIKIMDKKALGVYF